MGTSMHKDLRAESARYHDQYGIDIVLHKPNLKSYPEERPVAKLWFLERSLFVDAV